jgi:hypothetical protein
VPNVRHESHAPIGRGIWSGVTAIERLDVETLIIRYGTFGRPKVHYPLRRVEPGAFAACIYLSRSWHPCGQEQIVRCMIRKEFLCGSRGA